MTRRTRKATPASIALGVLSELLLAFGVLAGGFLPWFLYVHNPEVASAQQEIADGVSSQWEAPATDGDPEPQTDAPVTPVSDGQTFAVMHIPRLGQGWSRAVAENTGANSLNHIGAGHYPSTSLLGQAGNFAVASHRGGFGSSLKNAPQLRPGDSIWMETEAGWYQYTYRSQEYVWANAVDVLNPVPHTSTQLGVLQASDATLTLTTCNPYPSTNGERLITYADYVGFYPRDGGTPKELQ